MKRAYLVVLIGWLVPAPAFASPCIVGSLASYVALGNGGCNIGDAQFYNFVDLPLQGGAFVIPDTNVLVNPVDSMNPGFRFDVNGHAPAGDIFERVIGYSLSGPGFLGSQLALTGSDVSGDGAVTVLEKGCLGAAFGAGQFCSGIDAPLGAFDLGPFGQQLNDSTSFARTTLLGTIVDITVDGGTGGAAGLTSATTRFTAAPVSSSVPEPATLTLLALGLVAGIGRQRRRVRKPIDAASDVT
jgi:hypothetical protein